jgi:hypothetical protein
MNAKEFNAAAELLNMVAIKKQVEGIPSDRLQEICDAERESRLLVLPTKIGGSIYVIYEDEEIDGADMSGVEELKLSGYIKEGEREFYTTYDDKGTCDILKDELFLSREAAEEALIKMCNREV